MISLQPKEWEVVRNIPTAVKVVQIARRTGIPLPTVTRIVRRLRERGAISAIPRYSALGLSFTAFLFDVAGLSDRELNSFLERLEELPYKVSISILRGVNRKYVLFIAVPPIDLLERYIDLLPREPVRTVRGYPLYWRPDIAKLTNYIPHLNVLLPNFEGLPGVLQEALDHDLSELLPSFREERAKFDLYDLYILAYRQEYAFNKLRVIADRIGISKQLLSYHFRRHVIPHLWDFNAVKLYLPLSQVPLSVLALEGREAVHVAYTLTQMPYFYSAIVGEKAAVVFYQLPCPFLSRFYRVLSEIGEVGVEAPLGVLCLDERYLRRWVPRYPTYFKEGRWVLVKGVEAETPERGC